MKIHSKIDVITNSSTEVFILNTTRSLDEVKVILSKITSGYCDPEVLSPGCEVLKRLEEYGYLVNEDSVESMRGYWLSVFMTDSEFDYSTYKEVKIPGGEDIKEAWYRFMWDRKEEINNKKRKDYPMSSYLTIPENYTYDQFRDRCTYFHHLDFPDGMIEEFIKEYRASGKPIPDSLDNIPEDKKTSKYYGKIGFVGESDNSIPYETWDSIERILDSQNWHLG